MFIFRVSFGRLSNGLQKCPRPVNTLPSVVKGTLQMWWRILRLGRHPGLSRGVQCNHKGQRQEGQNQREDLRMGSRNQRGKKAWCSWPWRCKKWSKAKGCRWRLEARKGSVTNLPLEPPGGTSPNDTLTLAQWNWLQTADLQNYKRKKSVLF